MQPYIQTIRRTALLGRDCPHRHKRNREIAMKVVILGAGVLGVATAWYLNRAGHEVTVIERADGAALDTSFANAGQISPGYSTPWAAPGIPLKAAKWLLQKHAPLIVRPDGSRFQWQWLQQMLANCNQDDYAVNKERMVRIAEYSRDLFEALRAETNIQYEGRQQGTLQVFRTQKQIDALAKDISVLEECGVPFQVLDARGCAEYEPALAEVQHKLTGGLRLPHDETGDCHLFTRNLAQMCADNGVVFHYNHTIERIEHDNQRVTAVRANGTSFVADHYVCALGSYSRDLLLTIGVDLPIYPVKGYSLTIPIADAEGAPVSTVMDESHKIAITRFDDRIRVGGMAELSGYQIKLDPRRRETLAMVVSDLFPRGGHVAQASFWSGLRPMTPDSTPIIGGSRFQNLSLNTGHGTLGWTMCLGSGKVLADLVSGRVPDIDATDLSLQRYAKGSAVLSVPMR